MLTMAQLTPQIDKGEGLELCVEKGKRPDVSTLHVGKEDGEVQDGEGELGDEVDTLLADKS